MKFLPQCLKCDSTDVDMFRDRTFSCRGWPYDATLHCRTCGHRLYGRAAVEATAKARDQHLAAQVELAQAKVREIERQREEERLRREAEQVRLAQEMEREIERQREEERRKVIPFICAWKECDNPRREKSIYCSRNCSNKNARARHAARQSSR